MSMTMIVTAHAAEAIGTALGLERRRDEADLGPQFLDQFHEHIIIANAKRIRQQLRRRMAIAEMPGNPRNDMRIDRAEFNQTFRFAGHDDDVTRLQFEAIAIDKCRRLREIDKKLRALGTRQRAPATAAIVEIQLNRVDHAACIEAAVCKGLGRSDHGGTVSNSVDAKSARPITHAARNADRAVPQG